MPQGLQIIQTKYFSNNHKETHTNTNDVKPTFGINLSVHETCLLRKGTTSPLWSL